MGVTDTPKPNQINNELKTNFILTKIVHQKTELQRFIEITEHSNKIITTGSGYCLRTNYYTANTQAIRNSQNSGMMIQSAHLLLHKGGLSGVTQRIQLLTNRERVVKGRPEDTVSHQKCNDIQPQGVSLGSILTQGESTLLQTHCSEKN